MSTTQTPSTITFEDITRTPVTFAGARLVGYTEHPSMSEETEAFSADVYVHDVKVGVLRNSGRGGEDIFTPASPSGMAAFRTAEKSFPGIADEETGWVYDLPTALAEFAGMAKRLSGKKISFVPDVTPEETLRTGRFKRYALPVRLAKDLERTLPFIMNTEGVDTLLYPVRDRGYWFHYATR